jgi:hypothetical protein
MIKREAAMGGGDAQRPAFILRESEKTGARSAQARCVAKTSWLKVVAHKMRI